MSPDLHDSAKFVTRPLGLLLEVKHDGCDDGRYRVLNLCENAHGGQHAGRGYQGGRAHILQNDGNKGINERVTHRVMLISNISGAQTRRTNGEVFRGETEPRLAMSRIPELAGVIVTHGDIPYPPSRG